MATEHELISLLEGCLTCVPELRRMPIGEKIRKVVAEFYEAEALGFQTTAEMDRHAEWLRKHGTGEYRKWLDSLAPAAESPKRPRP